MQAEDSSMPQQPRPVSPVPLKLGSIPKELKALDRWVLWKYTWIVNKKKEGKWTKVPHSAVNGYMIDATNVDNGASFMQAAQALRKNKPKFDGLGFILGDGIAGIDMDDCIDNDGNLDERGLRMSKAYAGTYAEVSPSGQGFKIILNIGKDPKLASIGTSRDDMEIYGGKRYFAVTGSLLPGHAKNVALMTQTFAKTAEEMGVNKHLKKVEPTQEGPTDISDLKSKLGFDYKTAREMIDHMPFMWIDDYRQWLRAGMALHHEFNGAPEALELWEEWSRRNPDKYTDEGSESCAAKWKTFGKPGKDEQVTMRTLKSAAEALGWRAPSTIAQAISDFTLLDDTPEVDGDGVITDWWTRYSVGPLLREQPAPKRWVWPGLLLESKVMVLAGSGGSSKSYLMLAAATQYALGQSWGPFELPEGPQEGKVLVLYGEEDRQDVHHRLHDLKHSMMLTDEQIGAIAARMAVMPLRGQRVVLAEYDGPERKIQITKALMKLEERVVSNKIKLLILDPMAMLHGLEENDNLSIGHFVGELDAMCMRSGCSIVLIHHFSKSIAKAREVNESNIRGASSLVNHVRTCVVVHRLRRDEAPEWGVPEEDHARWTMFKVVKNNYGPSDRITWFNVNQANGVIAPSETQLTFMNSRDIRTAVLEARAQEAQEQDDELTEAEERRAREVAERGIQILRFMELIMREALDHYDGALPSLNACRELVLSADSSATGRMSREAIDRMKELNYVSEAGRQWVVNNMGRQWLEDREILS